MVSQRGGASTPRHRRLREMKYLRVVTAFTLAIAVVACSTPRAPIAHGETLTPENASECRSLCANAGLDLASVVVILNSVGCVCEPKHASVGAQHGGSTAAAGAVIIMAAAAAAQQQQQQQHR